jgi:hypothetical protein
MIELEIKIWRKLVLIMQRSGVKRMDFEKASC